MVEVFVLAHLMG